MYEEEKIKDIWKYVEEMSDSYHKNYEGVKRELENKFSILQKKKQ